MTGTEKDAGKMAPLSTTTTTPPGPPPNYVGWFANAAQRMLLQRTDIKQHVANHGRLEDFDAEMADWGQRFDGANGSLAEGSEVLFRICESFGLLKFVGNPGSGGPVRMRGAPPRAVRGAGDGLRLAQLKRELVRAFCAPG